MHNLKTFAQRFFCVALLVLVSFSAIAQSELPLKKRSAFYPVETLATVRANLQKHPDGERLRKEAIQRAAFWKNLSDDELWDLMFGSKIKRSWMVWSNGDCPSCQKSVPMYTWIMNPQKLRWKTSCPHCKEVFPKNDFEAFYRSGLDAQSVFDPARANRKLLFNTEHPEPTDPLHQFGVDDGEGYVKEGKRWRFIGAYLIYGQFKKLVVAGVDALAVAYVYTGDPVYARKAGIILDRVADLYPSFDYAAQGLVYEYAPHNGYISVWHDACEETRDLVLGYDRVFEGLKNDKELISFLSKKSGEKKLANPKSSFAEVQRNIENGLLRDPLKNQHKIHSNFPRAQCTVATIMTVLAWPENRAEVETYIDGFVKPATAVNGVTGEKGLSGYSSYTIAGFANFLADYCRAEADFLPRLIERLPSLKDTYRFHIDTLCLDRYYPNSGDCGKYDVPIDRYVGVNFQKLTNPTLNPSMFSFFWQLYESTKDPAYVQILYRANDKKIDGLPHDVLADNPEGFRKNVQKVLKENGTDLKLGSLNKEAWHLGILRSGKAEHARALWLDYDSGGAHGHHDGMNIGLFAHGLDLLPEFGYPAVQFGGWTSEKAQWYLHTAAHNTVVVNSANQANAAGETKLWADGKMFRAIQASAPKLVGGSRYERTVAMIDVSEKEFYAFDLFRVVGGADHAKFIHGPVGAMATDGLVLEPTGDYGAATQMRKFQRDTNSPSGWSATWTASNRHKAIPADKKISLRYTDFSPGTVPHTTEAWTAPVYNVSAPEIWNPALMIRRQGTAPLSSTFVGIFDAYEKEPVAAQISRMPITSEAGVVSGDGDVALQMSLRRGFSDLIVAVDAETHKEGFIQVASGWDVKLTGELALVRRDGKNRITHAVLCNGTRLEIGNTVLESPKKVAFVEVDFAGREPKIVAGDNGVQIR